MPHKGVFGDGFQIEIFPHIAAIKEFQDQTATGKLKAVIVPTNHRGCHCSYILWLGLSECIVFPYNILDCPTAKSAISIIS